MERQRLYLSEEYRDPPPRGCMWMVIAVAIIAIIICKII